MKEYPLRVLFWESTLKCNAYCEFCGSRCGDVSYLNELSKEEICYVFKQIADRYDASQIMINVSGGEPLMRNDLMEIMQYAITLGYHWGLVTNGILLNEDIISRLKNAELKTVSISIDGLQQTHDSLRGVKGGFDTVIHNLSLLSKADFLETIMITTVVSKRNICELDSIKKMLKTLPVNVWRICPVDPIGRAVDDRQLLLDKEQMHVVYDYIVRCQTESLPFQVTTSCSHYLGKYEFKTRGFPFQCNAGKTVGSILANGDIFVRSNVPKQKDLIQGNVRVDNFVDVWENGFRYFRDAESRHNGRCSKCKYFSLCQADSLHTWNFDRAEPSFCMLDYGFEPTNNGENIGSADLLSIIKVIKGDTSTISDAWVKAQSLAKDIVLITPNALKDILDYFSWGSNYPSVEKICALIGRIYRNSKTNEEAFIVCVDKILLLDIKVATSDTLVIDNYIEKQVENYLFQTKENLLHIGYIHSHPNDLEISMSLGDYMWHRKLFESDWKKALTIIINPQKKHIAAYAGPAANHVELHLLGYNELNN